MTSNLNELKNALCEDFESVRFIAGYTPSPGAKADYRIAEARLAEDIIAIEFGQKPLSPQSSDLLEKLKDTLYKDFDSVRSTAGCTPDAKAAAEFRVAEARIAKGIIAIELGQKPLPQTSR